MIHTDDFTYVRQREAIRRVQMSAGYRHKFEDLLAAIHDHRARGDDVLTVSHPGILPVLAVRPGATTWTSSSSRCPSSPRRG